MRVWPRLSSVTDATRDAASAAILAAASFGFALSTTSSPEKLVYPVTALLCTVPLAWRRRKPLVVVGVVVVGIITEALLARASESVWVLVGLLVSVYSAAAYSNAVRAFAALFASIAAAAFVEWRLSGSPFSDIDLIAVLLIGSWLAGRAADKRHRLAAALTERNALLQENEEMRLRQAIVAERSRIARELHDIVGHSVSLMVVQAQAATASLERSPQRAARAMARVERVGRAALDEMRRTLGLLRSAEGEPADGTVSLDGLHALADEVRAAGVEVNLAVSVDVPNLPASISSSAYRIVQEALTNVLKHSGASVADVTVERRGDDLVVAVVDDGRGDDGVSSNGYGLAGIAERVALFSGTLVHRTRSPAGYEVCAHLPLPPT